MSGPLDTVVSVPSVNRIWLEMVSAFKQGLRQGVRSVSDAWSPGVVDSWDTDKPDERLRVLWEHGQTTVAWFSPLEKNVELDTSSIVVARTSRCRPTFEAEVRYAVEQEPLEDGYEHPAEKLIGEALDADPEEAIQWLRFLVFEQRNVHFVASVIKCVGRLAEEQHPDWAYEFARNALLHQDVEVRDAAAQALELWGTSQSLEILTRHHEEVHWLRDYINRVVEQLKRQ
jgi:hypothetical protein